MDEELKELLENYKDSLEKVAVLENRLALEKTFRDGYKRDLLDYLQKKENN